MILFTNSKFPNVFKNTLEFSALDHVKLKKQKRFYFKFNAFYMLSETTENYCQIFLHIPVITKTTKTLPRAQKLISNFGQKWDEQNKINLRSHIWRHEIFLIMSKKSRNIWLKCKKPLFYLWTFLNQSVIVLTGPSQIQTSLIWKGVAPQIWGNLWIKAHYVFCVPSHVPRKHIDETS